MTSESLINFVSKRVDSTCYIQRFTISARAVGEHPELDKVA